MTDSGRAGRDKPEPLNSSAKPGNATCVQEGRKHWDHPTLSCSGCWHWRRQTQTLSSPLIRVHQLKMSPKPVREGEGDTGGAS